MTEREMHALCGECDGRRLPANVPEDEYAFIGWNLERWHYRAYRHRDPWRDEQSQVQVWT